VIINQIDKSDKVEVTAWKNISPIKMGRERSIQIKAGD
jgi:hypothetical protein